MSVLVGYIIEYLLCMESEVKWETISCFYHWSITPENTWSPTLNFHKDSQNTLQRLSMLRDINSSSEFSVQTWLPGTIFKYFQIYLAGHRGESYLLLLTSMVLIWAAARSLRYMCLQLDWSTWEGLLVRWVWKTGSRVWPAGDLHDR